MHPCSLGTPRSLAVAWGCSVWPMSVTVAFVTVALFRHVFSFLSPIETFLRTVLFC